jgi:HPt (histidine-containing phosphotransfer) domain-containing protein
VTAGPPTPEPGRREDPVDEAVLRNLRDLGGDDPEFVPGLVREFLVHAQRAVSRLRIAAERRDATELKDAAHGLKGSAGRLGARHLAALCADLDARARAGALDGVAGAVEAIAREAQRVRARLEAVAAPGARGGERP